MYSSKISVIVPVYNAEKYIERCIKSILNQSYHNFELILVNDGSDDNSYKICSKYAQSDARIILITQENEGVSSARNKGLGIMTGDLCAFIDSDDVVNNRYLENLYNALNEFQADIAICNCFTCTNKEYESISIDNKYDGTIVLKKIPVDEKYDYSANYSHYTVWGALFTKRVIKGLEFVTDIFLGEDSLFYAMALSRSVNIVYLNEPLYYYIKNETSFTNSNFNEKKLTELVAWKRICKLFSTKSDYCYSKCLGCYGLRCARMLKLIARSQKLKQFKQESKQILSELRQNIWHIFKSKISFKEKLISFCFAGFPKIMMFLYSKKKVNL